jgi:hypothetical protein
MPIETNNLEQNKKTINGPEKTPNQDAGHLDKILASVEEKTTEQKVDPKSQEIADKLRLDSFEKFSPQMKEALSLVGKIFKDSKSWAIHGSTALVLESETSKKPNDIDIAFADVDKEMILANFHQLAKDGLARKVQPQKVEDFNGIDTGCTRISAELRVGTGTEEDPFDWVEIEAYAQNVDPNMPANGISNVGYEKMTIMQYEGADKTVLNFASKEENFKFYLQIAAIELQKYQLENAFGPQGLKNKFPQRLNNIIAIIKRTEREIFEEKLAKGEAKEEDRPNTEEVSVKNITELLREFTIHNNDTKIYARYNKQTENTLDPVTVLIEKWGEFKGSRGEATGEHAGFVTGSGLNREGALDLLTKENLQDMTDISTAHNKIKNLKGRIEEQVNKCGPDCTEEGKSSILLIKQAIAKQIVEVQEEITEIKKRYEEYLGKINYQDNKDFIPYIAIKETLESYIEPSIKLTNELQKEIESISF